MEKPADAMSIRYPLVKPPAICWLIHSPSNFDIDARQLLVATDQQTYIEYLAFRHSIINQRIASLVKMHCRRILRPRHWHNIILGGMNLDHRN